MFGVFRNWDRNAHINVVDACISDITLPLKAQVLIDSSRHRLSLMKFHVSLVMIVRKTR